MDDMNERSAEVLDQFSIQLARVVLAAGFYEDELSQAISGALNLNTLQCNALVRPMNTRAKLDLCVRLMGVASKADQQLMRRHTDLAKGLFDDRNSLIHGVFGHDADNKVSVRSYTGRNKLTGEPKRWRVQEISALASDILELKDQLGAVRALLSSALRAHEREAP